MKHSYLIWLSAVALAVACGTPSSPPASGDLHKSEAVASQAPAAATPPKATPTPPAQPLEITKKGWGKDQFGAVGYAFIVQNPNQLAATHVSYQVAFFDADGTVLQTDSGSTPLIAANTTTGIAGWSYLTNKNATIARMDVQVKPGALERSEIPADVLTAQNVTYLADQYQPSVTGVVLSKAAQDLKQIRVSAVTYGADGNINGGGFTYVDFVPANGQAAVKVSVKAGGAPAKIELYPAPSSLTLP